jgi:hypothetical protein
MCSCLWIMVIENRLLAAVAYHYILCLYSYQFSVRQQQEVFFLTRFVTYFGPSCVSYYTYMYGVLRGLGPSECDMKYSWFIQIVILNLFYKLFTIKIQVFHKIKFCLMVVFHIHLRLTVIYISIENEMFWAYCKNG